MVSDIIKRDGQASLTVAVATSFTIFAVIVGLVVFITYFSDHTIVPEVKEDVKSKKKKKKVSKSKKRPEAVDQQLFKEWEKLKDIPIVGTVPFEESSLLKNLREEDVDKCDIQISGVLNEKADSICCFCCLMKGRDGGRCVSQVFTQKAVKERISSRMKETVENFDIAGADVFGKEDKFEVCLSTTMTFKDGNSKAAMIRCDTVCEKNCCRGGNRGQEITNSTGFPSLLTKAQLKNQPQFSISNFTLSEMQSEEDVKIRELLKLVGTISISFIISLNSAEEVPQCICFYIQTS